MGVYRNKKTGLVIETNCRVSGEDWEAVAPATKPVKDRKPAKKEAKAR